MVDTVSWHKMRGDYSTDLSIIVSCLKADNKSWGGKKRTPLSFQEQKTLLKIALFVLHCQKAISNTSVGSLSLGMTESGFIQGFGKGTQ